MSWAEVEQFERFMVVFKPKRTDDLKPATLFWVGRTFEVEALWIQEEGDPYAGEWVFMPIRTELAKVTDEQWSGWMPQCDLELLTPVVARG